MEFDADLTACARLVEQGDPHRFRAAMAAPVKARAVLFPIYAFNVEVARAPWVTQEPMIAEMRLQWWRDVCEEIAKGGPVRRHEVTSALGRAIATQDADVLDELVAARRWDIYKDAFEDAAHFSRYIDQTAGHLMWVAARSLGAQDESVVRDAAFASGIAGFFRAIPALQAAGRIPMVDGTQTAVSALASEALERLVRARSQRSLVPVAARGAMLPLAGAGCLLRAAQAQPWRVAEGALPEAPLRLTWRALSGRW